MGCFYRLYSVTLQKIFSIDMRFISTSGNYEVDLRQAALHCFAPDGTLYLPKSLPRIPRALFNNIGEMTLDEVGYVVMNTLLYRDLSSADIKDVVEMALNFPIPMVNISANLGVLELFHGPTLAFKDVSARFLAALLQKWDKMRTQRFQVLTATTGNTGGAIANAFAGMGRVEVMVLYPRSALSRLQSAQFTTIGRNIHAVEVSGTIAQCKKMVYQACCDHTLDGEVIVTCANTQNILRILAQIVPFFWAYAQLKAVNLPADGFNVAIPCGNLSNLVSAVLAKRMGLPIGKIIAGCNANDDFVRLLHGEITIDKVNANSRRTLASAMDTGYPTNIHRILALYNNDLAALRADIEAYAISDDVIAEMVVSSHDELHYEADPHTAVALAAAAQSPSDGYSVVMATAHPAKSLDTMTAITGRAVELPLQLTKFMGRPIPPIKIAPSYQAFRKLLTN